MKFLTLVIILSVAVVSGCSSKSNNIERPFFISKDKDFTIIQNTDGDVVISCSYKHKIEPVKTGKNYTNIRILDGITYVDSCAKDTYCYVVKGTCQLPEVE